MLLVLVVPLALVIALAIQKVPEAPVGGQSGPDPQAGFEFEQIGVGVERLVHDGAGHHPGDRFFLLRPQRQVIAFEDDGRLLLCCTGPGLLSGPSTETRLYRLGDSEPVVSWDDTRLVVGEPSDMAAAGSGSVWLAGPGLASLDGDAWSIHRRKRGSGIVEVAPDGTAWADTGAKQPTIVRVQGGRTRVFTPGHGLPTATAAWGGDISDIAATPDSKVWVGVGARDGKGPGGLLRHDGERWRIIRPLGRGIDARVEGLAAATDGALWVYLSRDRRAGSSKRIRTEALLARWDGERWQVLGEDDGVPDHGPRGRSDAPRVLMEAGPDGSIWLTPLDTLGCRHLVSFRDGVATEHLPESFCVHDLEIDPDGRAWVIAERSGPLAGDEWSTGLYVVDPLP